MQSIALVGMNGSIDFLCYPDFDSPTVFAALLDNKNGGCFQIAPQLTNARVRQLYLPETNILLTRFLADEGVAELTDYMPIEDNGEQPNEIVRRVSVIKGNIHFTTHCQPRFNYAKSSHRTENCRWLCQVLSRELLAHGSVLHRCSRAGFASRNLAI
jgi:GH15 family glucan-1,4-alpha-glucosidase